MALWTPAELTTELWLDADDASTLTVVSNKVTQWDDKSGNGRNAVVSGTGADNSTVTQNSKVVLDFQRTGHYTLSGLDSISGGASAFIVVKTDQDPTSSSGQGSGLWNVHNVTSGFSAQHYPFDDSNVYETFGSTARKSTGNPTPALNAWRIYNVDSEASNFTTRFDGTQHYTTATNTFGISGSVGGGMQLGNSVYASNTTYYRFDGQIAEFIVIEGVVDQSTRETIEGYLAHKWGLEANLPASHPYKSYAPLANPWTPAEITTAAWYDASDASTITESSGDVSQWDDKSGNARHLTQATGSLQPTYNSANDSIDFASDYLDYSVTGSLTDNGGALIAVYQNDAAAALGGVVTEDVSSANGRRHSIVADTRTNDRMSRYSPNVSGSWIDQDITQSQQHLGVSYQDGSDHYARLDGTQVGTVANSDTFGGLNTRLTVGRQANGDFRLTGKIYEVIVLDSTPTVSDLEVIEGYLAWKWGIQASLPGGHPYESAPPEVASSAQTIAVGLAEETDSAFAIDPLTVQTIALGLAEESDLANNFAISFTQEFGSASETQAAGDFQIDLRYNLGAGSETQTSNTFSILLSTNLGTAFDSGIAGNYKITGGLTTTLLLNTAFAVNAQPGEVFTDLAQDEEDGFLPTIWAIDDDYNPVRLGQFLSGGSIPNSKPEEAGKIWNDDGVIKISTGPDPACFPYACDAMVSDLLPSGLNAWKANGTPVASFFPVDVLSPFDTATWSTKDHDNLANGCDNESDVLASNSNSNALRHQPPKINNIETRRITLLIKRNTEVSANPGNIFACDIRGFWSVIDNGSPRTFGWNPDWTFYPRVDTDAVSCSGRGTSLGDTSLSTRFGCDMPTGGDVQFDYVPDIDTTDSYGYLTTGNTADDWVLLSVEATLEGVSESDIPESGTEDGYLVLKNVYDTKVLVAYRGINDEIIVKTSERERCSIGASLFYNASFDTTPHTHVDNGPDPVGEDSSEQTLLFLQTSDAKYAHIEEAYYNVAQAEEIYTKLLRNRSDYRIPDFCFTE